MVKMRHGLQTLLQCYGCVQSKDGVNLVEISIFKLKKTSGQIVWPIMIKTVALLCYHGCLDFKLFLAFAML